MEQQASSQVNAADFIKAVHGVRYQVRDVARAVTFYTQRLGFTLKHQQLPAFANVSLRDTEILLSGPGASGSRPMPNGEHQTPGGWNRVVLKVTGLSACTIPSTRISMGAALAGPGSAYLAVARRGRRLVTGWTVIGKASGDPGAVVRLRSRRELRRDSLRR